MSEKPRDFNYVLHVEDHKAAESCKSFISFKAIQYASDKRSLAAVFNERRIQIPRTVLFSEFADAKNFIRSNAHMQWCLKYLTSCGANGHRMLLEADSEPANWPKPYVVQEFVALAEPEGYRTCCAGGEIFGWVVRRFPKGAKKRRGLLTLKVRGMKIFTNFRRLRCKLQNQLFKPPNFGTRSVVPA